MRPLILILLLVACQAIGQTEKEPKSASRLGYAFCKQPNDKSVPVYLTDCSASSSEDASCGEEFEIAERHGPWLKIRLAGGAVRYLEASSVSLDKGKYTSVDSATDVPDKGAPECDAQDPQPTRRQPPHVVYTPDPEYSLSARKKKIQGIVVVSLTVDIAGQPRDLRVERKLDRELDEAAIDAVRQWKFEPATQDGRPVEVRVNVEVAFHLYK